MNRLFPVFTIIFAIAAFSAIELNAQERRLPSTGYGVKAGTTIASYNIEGSVLGFEEQLASPVAGFHAGVVARWASGSIPLTVRGEIIYDMAKLRREQQGGRATLNITSFCFPIMAGVNIRAFNGAILNLHAGPAFNIMSRTTLSGEDEWAVTELLRKPSVSIAAGAGISYWRATLEVRYNFYPATRSVDITLPGRGTSKARSGKWGSWNISLGMHF